MSVIARRRHKSKLKVLDHADRLQADLRDLMLRNFGVKDPYKFVRPPHCYGKTPEEARDRAYYIIDTHKHNLDHLISVMIANLRAAHTLCYPISIEEYDKRREFQNFALINCEQITKELQTVVRDLDVDLNVYKRCVKSIDEQEKLIRKWRSSDNKIKRALSEKRGGSSANFANVNNNGNANNNNSSNTNIGVRPDSMSNQQRRRRCPFRKDK